VKSEFNDTEKVQQFLVENVARLRMTPVERALLIAFARAQGEETASVARRFGVSATTVRKLELQLGDASASEIKALRSGEISLSFHAVIARYIDTEERPEVFKILDGTGLKATQVDFLLMAIGWRNLSELGASSRIERLDWLRWAVKEMSSLPTKISPQERIRELGARLLESEILATKRSEQ